MKKTLLISSALASGIIYSGSALAQTTVSGQLDLHYKAMSFDGTGLGLAVVKDLVQLLGGNIQIHGQKGIGTIIIFSTLVSKI